MRIQCPFCGERDLSEFSYRGDAAFKRPDAGAANAAAKFFSQVYLRTNPAGVHEELWYHVFGCRSWIRVTRDTRTHEVLASASGKPADAGENPP
jgi:methylglutamate dehydrogenase subunit B